MQPRSKNEGELQQKMMPKMDNDFFHTTVLLHCRRNTVRPPPLTSSAVVIAMLCFVVWVEWTVSANARMARRSKSRRDKAVTTDRSLRSEQHEARG